MLLDTTGPLRVTPSPSLMELPLGSVHDTSGVMPAVAMQVRVYALPASMGLEGPRIVTWLFNSERKIQFVCVYVCV